VTTIKGGKDKLKTPEYILSDRRKIARRRSCFRSLKAQAKAKAIKQ